MNKIFTLKTTSIFLFFCSFAFLANAQHLNKPENMQNHKNSNFVPGEEAKENRRQLRQLQDLEFFINLPEHKLNKMQILIERISKMTPEEKEEIKQKIVKFKKLNKDKQKELFQKYQEMPDIDKYALWKHFSSMTHEQRGEENKRLKDLTNEQKQAHRQSIIDKFKEENPDFKVPNNFELLRENKIKDMKLKGKKRPNNPNFDNEKDIIDSINNQSSTSEKQ